MKIGQTTLGELMPIFIVLFVCLIFLVFLVFAIIAGSKVRKKEKNKVQELKTKGLTFHTYFSHLNGLPIAEGTMCEFFSYPDRYEFKVNKTDIKLPKDRITDVCVKTDVEIQQQYVSSAGGAIGGAIMFGAVGALIGGRAKKKQIKTVEHFLIITYTKDDEIKHIGFNVTNDVMQAGKVVAEFKKENSAVQAQSIEL